MIAATVKAAHHLFPSLCVSIYFNSFPWLAAALSFYIDVLLFVCIAGELSVCLFSIILLLKISAKLKSRHCCV